MTLVARFIVVALIFLNFVAIDAGAQKASALAWAIPREGPPAPASDSPGQVTSLAGSDLNLTQEQIDNPFNTPDWFPERHDPMPQIVKYGREPDIWACAMCHLATGNGHPQSAKLAGNSSGYLIRQLDAFKARDRVSFLPEMISGLHTLESDEDARLAAEWFASLRPTSHQTVIETDTVPVTTFYGTSMMRVVANDGSGGIKMEPIAGRIIEVPDNYGAVKARSPDGRFNTYVPEDSVERGQAIATQGTGSVAPCITCHGADLKGSTLGPALAGSFPTYVVRQFYDFKNNTRKGLADQTGYMGAISKFMSVEDIVNVAAYIGSLSP